MLQEYTEMIIHVGRGEREQVMCNVRVPAYQCAQVRFLEEGILLCYVMHSSRPLRFKQTKTK